MATVVIGNRDVSARLLAAMLPSLPTVPKPPAIEVQVWIKPPAYTGMAPIFLRREAGSVSVPAGSRLTVNVSGTSGRPTLVLNERSASFDVLDKNSFQAERDLIRGGLLMVRSDTATLGKWTLTVIADQPPIVLWGDKPGRSASGQQTRLPWEVSDDYGVNALQAEMRLRDRPKSEPLVVQLPLPAGSLKRAHGVNQPDLTANSWAGLPVVARLIAHDGPGQTGFSAEATFELGERTFRNHIAQVLISVRKGLSVQPDDRSFAIAALDGLMQLPAVFGSDLGAFVNLSAIYYDLVWNKTEVGVREAQEMIWELALHMEESQTEQSARLLDESRRAARDALEMTKQQPTDASRAELAKRLDELRQAIDRYMQALLEDARRNNDVIPFDPKELQLTDRDIDGLAEQAQQAAKEGRMSDAQQQMADLEKMLDHLRNSQAQVGDHGQAKIKRQKGKPQQGAVQDMIAREGSLLDHAQTRGNQTRGDSFSQRAADSLVQQALRGALGELMQEFSDITNEVSPALGEADHAMRDAQAQLDRGNDEDSRQSQQQAIAALQRGRREVAQAMAKQRGNQQGQGGESDDVDENGSGGGMGMMMPDGQIGESQGTGPMPDSAGRAEAGSRDPIGRYSQGSSTDSAEVAVPDDRERQRTKIIQEELRKRGSERERARPELDYIRRLLEQF